VTVNELVTREGIPALEAEVERLEDELHAANAALNAARIATAEFQVGDIVLVRKRGSERHRAIVREVQPMSWGPWYVVSFAKKDGEWSQSIYRAFGDVEAAL
jgi:hypothetical protein